MFMMNKYDEKFHLLVYTIDNILASKKSNKKYYDTLVKIVKEFRESLIEDDEENLLTLRRLYSSYKLEWDLKSKNEELSNKLVLYKLIIVFQFIGFLLYSIY